MFKVLRTCESSCLEHKTKPIVPNEFHLGVSILPVSFESRTTCYPVVTGCSTPKGQVVGFGNAFVCSMILT